MRKEQKSSVQLCCGSPLNNDRANTKCGAQDTTLTRGELCEVPKWTSMCPPRTNATQKSHIKRNECHIYEHKQTPDTLWSKRRHRDGRHQSLTTSEGHLRSKKSEVKTNLYFLRFPLVLLICVYLVSVHVVCAAAQTGSDDATTLQSAVRAADAKQLNNNNNNNDNQNNDNNNNNNEKAGLLNGLHDKNGVLNGKQTEIKQGFVETISLGGDEEKRSKNEPWQKPLRDLNNIEYYEPLYFDISPMRLHLRRKRSADDEASTSSLPLEIAFKAHKREFKIKLQPHPDDVFAPNVVFEEDDRRVFYDRSNVVQGVLEGEPGSLVQGVITSEGLFDGVVDDPSNQEQFYIEPSSRYIDTSDVLFHSIIYKASDVQFPENASCSSINATDGTMKHHRLFKDFPPSDRRHQSSEQIMKSRHKAQRESHAKHRSKRDRSFRPKFSDVVTDEDNNHIFESIIQEDDMFSYRQIQMDVSQSSGYGIRSVQRTMWVSNERHAKNIVVDPKKTTCMLYLQADHLFFQKMGSREACIESMTRHVQKVNSIYRGTDFDQDGRPDNISFLIKRIKVHTLESVNSPGNSYRFPSNYGVEKFLELFSEEDYDAFCLAYMFTYRDFEGGTLGLAWTGDLKNAGGVCEKNGHYRGSLKSLNTGIVTLLNYGKHVPPIVSHVTLAHEIGHSFGSPHDPKDDSSCTPGGEQGNYIMFAHATSGDKLNNNKFSPCSLRSINAVLNAKARNIRGCFSEPQRAICGNGVVEEDEECDCGWHDECKEECCVPMSLSPQEGAMPCSLRKGKVCSPSQGPCCTDYCELRKSDIMCREDNGCRGSAFCDGRGPRCPPSISKPNKTICNEEFVCYMGECTGSICTAYGLESCQCRRTAHDSSTKACELCCRLPGDDSTCKSSFEWNQTPYDVPDLYAKPGTPCDQYNGYCDVFQRCREIDPSGPLATLRNLLLSTRSISTLTHILYKYAPLIIFCAVCVFVLFLVLLRMVCSPSQANVYYKQRITADRGGICSPTQSRPPLLHPRSNHQLAKIMVASNPLMASSLSRSLNNHTSTTTTIAPSNHHHAHHSPHQHSSTALNNQTNVNLSSNASSAQVTMRDPLINQQMTSVTNVLTTQSRPSSVYSAQPTLLSSLGPSGSSAVTKVLSRGSLSHSANNNGVNEPLLGPKMAPSDPTAQLPRVCIPGETPANANQSRGIGGTILSGLSAIPSAFRRRDSRRWV